MNFSVIIPAHNEEDFIAPGLEAIAKAYRPPDAQVEVVVVLNRCTDGTEQIAHAYGARTIVEDARVISTIRNAGVRVASHEVIVTIDADSVMSPTMFVEIERMLASGKYIGGGAEIKMERTSFPLWLTEKLMKLLFLATGVNSGGGLYWCLKKDFDAVGGFDEKLKSAEDMEFAARLKKYGRAQGKRFGIVRKAHIVFSCRKFDVFGDWAFLKAIFNPMVILRSLRRKNDDLEDRALYDFDNHEAARLRDANPRGGPAGR